MGCIGCFSLFIIFAIFIWLFDSSPTLAVFFIIGLIALGFWITRLETKRKQEKLQEKQDHLQQLIDYLDGFIISQEFTEANYNSRILLDEQHKKIAFLYTRMARPFVYDFKDVYESEVLIDGTTVTSTKRGSQVAGALVGGILAGSAGMVVGGLSGKTIAVEEVNKIDLKILINDSEHPHHVINFLTAPIDEVTRKQVPVAKGGLLFDEAMKGIEHWHGLLSIIIKNEAKKEIQGNRGSTTREQGDFSVADELKKLWNLVESGAITKEEYERLKQDLLSEK